MKSLVRGALGLTVVAWCLLGVAASWAAAQEADFVWLEGEKPTASNVPVKAQGSSHADWLSGGVWGVVSIDADKVEKELPADGGLLSYSFRIGEAGTYQVWDRIGFEFARSPFEWRIDEGAWTSVSPEALTTNAMELDFFAEAAWLQLTSVDLSAGEHTLQIRLPRSKDEKGNVARVLYASDAICISPSFRPNSRYKPNESGRGQKDEQAAQQVFALPEAASAEARAQVQLNGLWEIARDDEQMPREVAEPVKELPKDPIFTAIEVPGDKNKLRPDLLLAHRLWYRTRVNVPASLGGRAFYIDFPQNNLNTTVYVNGVLCGFEKNPFCRFQIDVTRGIKAGQVNEIWVGIRDAWYGRTANPDNPMKLRKTFHLPVDFFHRGFQDLDYPIWNSPQSGILTTPTLVAAGGVYTSDVFAKPNVADKKMEAEVTLTNTTAENASGEIRWEAINDKTNEVEKTFAAKAFDVAAGQQATLQLADAWENAKLWWPDEPNLYRLRTTVTVGGKPVDVNQALFGFRQWKNEGIKFTLNGVVWHLWADLIGEGSNPQQWLEAYRRGNQRLTRLATSGQGGESSGWMGMSPNEALEFFDRNGVVVRRNSSLDGEAIGSNFSENDPAIVAKQGGSNLKLALMKNWRDQCVAQVKGERNHPSIQIWTIENEFAYINLINLLGNSPTMDAYEKEIQACSDAVMAVDPTRTVMIDGGGALKDNTLPVHGDHYVATLDSRYPDLAYEPFVKGGGRGRWTWDMTRPRYIGEDFFATGINPADYAMWGGEIAFQGKAQTRDAVALCYRMLQEGYRWGGYYAAWHFWLGGEGGAKQRIANAPRAALVRQWDWTFGSGQTITRSFGVFNDTQHPDPITFTRSLVLDGQQVWTQTTQHNVKPGTAHKFDEQIPMPQLQARQEGELVLTLSVNGQEIFRDSKAVSVLPVAAAAQQAQADAQAVVVFDPKNELAEPLKAANTAFTPVNSLENLPENAKVLIVGRDAIGAEESTSTRLAIYASTGRTVIVLEQENPLKYQAIPAEMDLAPRTGRSDFGDELPLSEGRAGFIEDVSHPAFRGLKDKDFFTWGPDHVLYRNAYAKPTRGGKSLLQVGPRLGHTALVEVPVGQGLMLLNQLVVGQKLNANPVARQLLVNLIDYGKTYKQEFHNVAAAVDDPQLTQALDAIGLRYEKATDAIAAISNQSDRIAIVSATPANLKLLASNLDKVQAFWQRGGTIVFHGLTPEGLADYNRIVGVEHLIRPFKRERVTFPPVRNPLTAGLTTGDIVMLSGERMFGWTADEYVSSDVFTHVVDYDEIAPFCTSSFFGWNNMVNGFVGSDGWPLIMDFAFPPDGKPYEFTIDLPREETIVEYIHDQSINYNPTTKLALLFDGQDRTEFALTTDGSAVSCPIAPPKKARQITVQLAEWQLDPAKAKNIGMDNLWIRVQRSPEFLATVKPMLNLGGLMQYVEGNAGGGVVLCNLKLQETEAVPVNKTKAKNIGMDNLWIRVERSPEFLAAVKPMLNLGGLMQYVKGNAGGGVVLCNLKLQETEAVPVNKTKKRTILATLLRNLKAPFAGGKTILAGAPLNYQPLDIHTKATTFKDERGWFGGDRNRTFKSLPQGRHVLGGVPFEIYEMPTSPVPQVLMLAGDSVPGNLPQEITAIPVNTKADALFFLHTARIDRPMDERDRRENKRYELARYVIHYTDGQSVEVPIFSQIDIGNFRQEKPEALPGAQIAWTSPYEGSGEQAVAYAKQWNNPRPDVTIESVDLVYGKDKDRGVPALIAITAASAQ